MSKYEVLSISNDRHGMTGDRLASRPAILFYLSGPGGPGPHGLMMSDWLYFDTKEAAEKALPIVDLAYMAGREDKLSEIQRILGVKK